jgi:putative membrane protein
MSLKKTKENKKSIVAILAIVIIAVLLVPMLYSSIYLGSIWDVYNKLDSVPVAFVNLDKLVTKEGKEYSIGKEVENNLKDNKKVAWKFVSHEEAMKGVEGTDYYAVIEIPEDFSEKIANAQEGSFEKPDIIYKANKGRNFIFSQVSQKVADSLRGEVSSNIQKEISKSLVGSLYDVKVSLKDAGDGAGELQGGTQKLFDGITQLSKGINAAAGGSKQLEAGLRQAEEGQKQLVSGTDSLINGLNQLKSSLTQKNESIPQLVNGASGVYNGVGAVKAGASVGSKNLSAGLNTAADGVKGVSDNIIKADALLASAVADYKTTGSFSADDIKNIMTAQAIMDGVKNSDINKNIGEPLRVASNSMKPLVDKLGELEAGAKMVSDGTSAVAKGIEETQSKAAEGTSQLIDGAHKLKEGSSQILGGLNTAAEKTGQLSNGINMLNEGALALKDGLKDANDGAIKLRDGLNGGYDKISDKLKFNSEDMSQFVSEPVALKESYINNIKYYGEGFGPYFISMSLWLGAMFISIILTILKSSNIFKSKFIKSFIGKLIAGSGLVTIQALILSVVVVKALGLNPASLTGFYVTNVFIAVVFFSFMYGVNHAIGILGAPIMFIILLLQLSSSGGTFPMEALPAFYRAVGKIIPMTYSVSSLKMVISGINSSILSHNLIIMTIFMMASLCGGFIIRLIINLVKNKNQVMSDSKSV